LSQEIERQEAFTRRSNTGGDTRRTLTFKHKDNRNIIKVGLLVSERMVEDESEEGDEVLESVNSIT